MILYGAQWGKEMFRLFIYVLYWFFLLGVAPMIGYGGREISSEHTPPSLSKTTQNKDHKKKFFSKKVSAKDLHYLVIQGQNVRILLMPSSPEETEKKEDEPITITVSCVEDIKERDIPFDFQDNGRKLFIQDKRQYPKGKATLCTYTIKVPEKCKVFYEFYGGKMYVRAEKIEGSMTVCAGHLFFDAKKSFLDDVHVTAGRAKIFLGKIQEKIFLNCGYGDVKIKEGPYAAKLSSEGKIPLVSVTQASGSFCIHFPEKVALFFPDVRKAGVYSAFAHTEKNFHGKILFFTPPYVKIKVLFSEHNRKKGSYYDQNEKIYK